MANVALKITSTMDGAGLKSAQSGINGLDQKVKAMTKSLKSATGPMNNLLKDVKSFSKVIPSVAAIGGAFAGVTVAVSKTVEAMNKCVSAYNEQVKAENKLTAAAKNNPYLLSSNVDNLKNYASQMEKLSGTSYEELLNQMTKLAASGRDENQIMKIIGASVDVAASGTMNLDSAVTALNATYSGTTGTLGKQLTAVKDLSKEELEQGAAVDIVAKAYEGLATQQNAVTDSQTTLNRNLDDIKKKMGELLKPTQDLGLALSSAFSETVLGLVNDYVTMLDTIANKISRIVYGSNNKKLIEYLNSSGGLSTEQRHDLFSVIDTNTLKALTAQFSTKKKLSDSESSAMFWAQNELNWREEQAKLALTGSGSKTPTTTTTTTTTETTEEEKPLTSAEVAKFVDAAIAAGKTVDYESYLDKQSHEETQAYLESLEEAAQKQKELNETIGAQLGEFGTLFNLTGTDTVLAFISELGSALNSIENVSKVLNPLNTILDKLVAVIEPAVNEALAPLVDVLTDIGMIIGELITPVMEVLGPLIEAVCVPLQLLVDIMGAFFNCIIIGVNAIYDVIAVIVNAVSDVASWFGFSVGRMEYKSLDSGFTTSAFSTSATAYSSSTSGSSASYTAAKDVTVNITYSNSYVNGDARAIALSIEQELASAHALGL